MKEKLELKEKQSSNKGFNDLLEVHTVALENNSKSVVEILELLSEKNLSIKDKEDLKKIKRELSSIDKRVDTLGTFKEEEESWW